MKLPLERRKHLLVRHALVTVCVECLKQRMQLGIARRHRHTGHGEATAERMKGHGVVAFGVHLAEELARGNVAVVQLFSQRLQPLSINMGYDVPPRIITTTAVTAKRDPPYGPPVL